MCVGGGGGGGELAAGRGYDLNHPSRSFYAIAFDI